MTDYKVKDSGERKEFDSGMVRDTDTNKPRYDLIWRPGIKRLAHHMGKGVAKYGEHNWMKARGDEELKRFRASAFRHFIQWMDDEVDEDHMSACIFNMFGAEYVREKKILSEVEWVKGYHAWIEESTKPLIPDL